MRRIGAVLLGAALTGAVGGGSAWSQEAGPEVYGAMREAGEARVVVFLQPPDPLPGKPVRVQSQIASQKHDVLFDIPPSEFTVTHEWLNLSALAGVLRPEGLLKLLSDPRVLRIDVDVPGAMATAESSPVIRANELQSRGITGAGVKVAVLDTGVDTQHPDLSDDLIDQQCFCTNADGSGCCPNGATSQSGPGAAEDAQGHGTNVAGIITGRGGIAPEGIAPDAKLIAIRVLDAQGTASGTAQVLSALDWIMTAHPDTRAVNLSLVYNPFPGTCDNAASFTQAFAQAIGRMRSMGMLVFASSGNNGLVGQIGLPACISTAVAVGATYDANVGSISFGCSDATTDTDQVACFSNSSSAVDLLAPGAAITSTGMGGGIVTFIGTSQASPHAAAVAALLFQANPGLTPDAAEALMKNTGLSVTDPKSGITTPRIDAAAAAQ